MTELGRNLIEEGVEKGIQKGIEKGKADLLIKQLMKKFKKLPVEYKEKIRQLPRETLEIIGMDIFELERVEDLERYM